MKNSNIRLFVNFISGWCNLFIDGDFVSCISVSNLDDVREQFHLFNFYIDGVFSGYDLILKHQYQIDLSDTDLKY
nr:hypothetical protein [Bacteroidota bacterium]